jgi:hypothetical protein
MGNAAVLITEFSPVTVPNGFNLVGSNLTLMRTIGIPTAGMRTLIRQFDMFDHNAVSIAAFQAVAHDLAVTTPECLDIFNLEYIGPKRSTSNV